MDERGTDAIARFVQRTGINYPILQDDGSASKSYGVSLALPTSVLIDRNRDILTVFKGQITVAEIEPLIRRMLGG